MFGNLHLLCYFLLIDLIFLFSVGENVQNDARDTVISILSALGGAALCAMGIGAFCWWFVRAPASPIIEEMEGDHYVTKRTRRMQKENAPPRPSCLTQIILSSLLMWRGGVSSSVSKAVDRICSESDIPAQRGKIHEGEGVQEAGGSGLRHGPEEKLGRDEHDVIDLTGETNKKGQDSA